MTRTRSSRQLNSGFTIVEVLIALAVLSVLIISIASVISSSLNNSVTSKELQYRNELAENLLEYAKGDSVDNILNTSYFTDAMGCYDVYANDPVNVSYGTKAPGTGLGSASDTANSQYDYEVTRNEGGSMVTATEYALYDRNIITGKMDIGTTHETYSWLMEISSEDYAKKEADSAGAFVNPNNTKLGIVEDMDYTKVALIPGTIANYDAGVSNAFLTRKLQLLRELDPTRYEAYVRDADTGAVNPFAGDKVRRRIIISAKNLPASEGGGYEVTCVLKYTDDSSYVMTSGTRMKDALISRDLNEVEYKPFSQYYDELPNIYLMYNVCVYNGAYADEDYIILDTSGITDGTVPNFFIVETAATYDGGGKDKVLNYWAECKNNGIITEEEYNALTKEIDALSGTLYNNDVASGAATRNDTRLYIMEDLNSNDLKLYHNFNQKDRNDNQLTTTNVIPDALPTDNTVIPWATHYLPVSGNLVEYDALNKANQENRGLYTVRIWMVKSDSISDVINEYDTGKDPVLTGTKGGDES